MTISAKIIADSVSCYTGKRIITFELEYPRFIHAEFMTHRLFSRNAASSRAIPVKTAIELILGNTAMPIHWGKNQPGMSAKEECDAHWIEKDSEGKTLVDWAREVIWNRARDAAISFARIFDKIGYHKQIVNRLLEPFTHIKVVLTATDYDNFYWLRCHPDAQPEIQELANKMREAAENSASITLAENEWHVPYYEDGYWAPCMALCVDDDNPVDAYGGTLQEAIMISSSCCAQVSYRKTDDTLEKAKIVYDRLVSSKPVHASPFEHQAMPIPYHIDEYGDQVFCWYAGITHQDRFNNAWSGNFMDWIQHRQLIPENAMNEVRVK